MDIEVDIEGVTDKALSDAIRLAVRTLGAECAQPGELRLTVSPSETRGQWDLGLRTLEGIVLSSWVDAAEALPKFVERTLRDYLTTRRTNAYRAMHWVLLIGLAALAQSV